jgi:Tfp pilus assembly protein PilE
MNVDMTIIYVIGIVVVVVGMVFGIAYLRKNNYVKESDLIFVSSILGIGIEILEELNLDKEKEILKISGIVQDSINFAIGMFDNVDNTYEKACEYAYNLCEQSGIQVTDSRRNIIQQLIRLGLEIKVVNE